jgi:Protein of unknown function (DUF3606)
MRKLRVGKCSPTQQGTDMVISVHKPNRNNVSLCDEVAVKHWVKHLGRTQEEIATAIEKVGPSCAAIRKELGLSKNG